MLGATRQGVVRQSWWRRALVAGLMVPAVALAAAMQPDQLVRTTTDKIMNLLRANHALYEKDNKKLREMVYTEILPHFDFTAMSKLVLGRHWRDATDKQREAFTGEFRDLLVRTYSTALLKYSDQDIVYLPYRGRPEDRSTTVSVEIRQKATGVAPIPMQYSFYNRDNIWKVYDVTIDGISLVTNYRSTYSEKIKNQGLDALIADLAKMPSDPVAQKKK